MIQLSKTLDWRDAEIKFEGENGTFRGYASKFNGVDSYGDTILPGAWKKTLEKDKTIPIFFNHDRQEVPIGKYTKAIEDEQGLYVEGALTLTIPKAREVYEAIKAGTVSGLSVGFICDSDGYRVKESGEGFEFSDITDLREISVCTYPADGSARITAVKCENIEDIKTPRDFEGFLRDSGFSKKDALTLVSRAKAIFAGVGLRDSEKEGREKFADALLRLSKKL